MISIILQNSPVTVLKEINLIQDLMTVAPVVGVLGWWIYSLKSEAKDQKEYFLNLIKDQRKEIAELTRDYKQMAEKSIEILTLTDDKLKKSEVNTESIKEIHNIVKELSTLVKNHLIK